MTFLTLYQYLFVAELLIAEGLLTFRLAKRKYFVWRALGGTALCFLAAGIFQLIGGTYNSWYVSFVFLVLFGVTFGTIALCFDVPLKNTFFCCLSAYTAQHLAYEIFKLALSPFSVFDAKDMYGGGLVSVYNMSSVMAIVALVYINVYLVVYAATYFILGKKIGREGDLRIKSSGLLMFSAVILLVDIILNAFTVYITEDYNFYYDIIIGVYNSLCCVLVFYIQLGIINTNDIHDELETVKKLLDRSNRQYEMRKEEIDLINIKCHDLKHRIGQYMGGMDEPTAKEINELISIYDCGIKTGNPVVDIILTEKNLICRGKGISLTCMADCSALSFVSEGDLYALFGNMVDNAMEAVSLIDDAEKRCVSLNIRSERGFVSVMCENYFEGEIKLDGAGMPSTSKSDKNYHGFGLKSIRVIAEKYGGEMSIVIDKDASSGKDGNGVFCINVMLPIPKTKK